MLPLARTLKLPLLGLAVTALPASALAQSTTEEDAAPVAFFVVVVVLVAIVIVRRMIRDGWGDE